MASLRQGYSPVEDFSTEFENLTVCCDMEERIEQEITRFIAGLHLDIREKIELQPNLSFEEDGNSVVSFDKQKRATKSSGKLFTNKSYSPPVKTSEEKTDEKKAGLSADKGEKPETPKDETPKITCFKCKGVGHYKRDCPTNRIMTMKEVREIHELIGFNDAMDEEDTEDEIASSEEECNPEKDSDTEERALVLRRALHAQTSSNSEQRENIFHTRCKIEKKTCNLIIDGGSYTNAISEKLVNRLQLSTLRHPRPYKLKWLDEDTEVSV